MVKVMTDLREKVAGVLTEEQKTKLGQMGGPGGPAGAAGRGNPIDRLQGILDKAELSSEQKDKVKPVLEDAKKKFEELRGQFQTGDRAALREKVKGIMDDTRDKLKDILTPAQAEKVKAALEAGRPGGAAPGAPAGPPPAAEPPKAPEKK
jgi:Spy/CpxP family protein refolding chaperone